MPEILLALVDDNSGELLVDATNPEIAAAMRADLDLGDPEGLGCALPLRRTVLQLEPTLDGDGPTAWIAGYWHNSLVEGPGRRSVVQFQGCPIHCVGCWVPETWAPHSGMQIAVDTIAEALLDPAYERDGVTIIGGEPFAQPVGLHELVRALRSRQPAVHITVYSGFYVTHLRHIGDVRVDAVLDSIDLLIDGPYVARLAANGGPWTGSGNQRVLGREQLAQSRT